MFDTLGLGRWWSVKAAFIFFGNEPSLSGKFLIPHRLFIIAPHNKTQLLPPPEALKIPLVGISPLVKATELHNRNCLLLPEMTTPAQSRYSFCLY